MTGVPAYMDLLAGLGGTAAAGLRCFVAFTVIAAGLGKLRQPLVFEGELADYRLLPAVLVAPVARSLPFVELALGAALLTQHLVAPVSYLAAALLLTFAVAVAVNLGRGRRHISCGCGGAASGRPIGETLVISNVGIAALLILAAKVQAPSSAVLNTGAILIGGGGYLLLQVFTMMRLLAAPAQRLAPGKDRA